MGRTVYLPIHKNHKNQLNVGKYTSPMDPMGLKVLENVDFDVFFFFG